MAEEGWEPSRALRGIAELDVDRTARRGYPEAVYCEGKTAEQVGIIAAEVRSGALRTLFTRAAPEHARAVQAQLTDAAYDPTARLLAWPAEPLTKRIPRADGRAAILTGRREMAAPLRLLTDRYWQYREAPPTGPVLAMTVERWTGWTGAG